MKEAEKVPDEDDRELAQYRALLRFGAEFAGREAPPRDSTTDHELRMLAQALGGLDDESTEAAEQDV